MAEHKAAKKPDKGAEEQVRLRSYEVAERLGITQSTWNSYVYRGQAPQPDGERDTRRPYWYESTIDEYAANRPGRGRPSAQHTKTERAPRRVFTPEFKAQTVREFHEAGQSIRQFALEHNLGESVLATWIRAAAAGKLPEA
jgi:hypothetical protein